MSAKRELYDFLQDFSVGDINSSYSDLYNAVIDYENETGDYSFEDYFNDFVDEELVIMRIEDMLSDRDLGMIVTFLSDINADAGLWKYDGYGWLQDVDDSDLYSIRDDILSELDIDEEDEDEEDYE